MNLSHKVISPTTGQTAMLFNNSIKEKQLKIVKPQRVYFNILQTLTLFTNKNT